MRVHHPLRKTQDHEIVIYWAPTLVAEVGPGGLKSIQKVNTPAPSGKG